MVDMCQHCLCRGDIVKCYAETDCQVHQSWAVKTMQKELYDEGYEDGFSAAVARWRDEKWQL